MIDRTKKILLGSGSPRRKLLLKELRYTFRVEISDADETPEPGMDGLQIAGFLAEKKAETLKAERAADEILLTADTIVWLKSDLLGKPEDESAAFSMLKRLSGKTHQVFTGVCLISKTGKKLLTVRSDVVFRKLNDDDIKEYIRQYKPFDKAGSYGAQECLPTGKNPCSDKEKKFLLENNLSEVFGNSLSKTGKHFPFIDHIEESYFNVMGLPIVEVVEALNSI